jgi:hypothetical protein
VAKKPKIEPELPPGKACFPQRLGPTAHDCDPQQRDAQQGVRWLQVYAMVGMTPAAFKKRYGFKKTLYKMHELVAASHGVTPYAIKKSCDLVDAAIKTGTADKFFAADWSPRVLGKARPPKV